MAKTRTVKVTNEILKQIQVPLLIDEKDIFCLPITVAVKQSKKDLAKEINKIVKDNSKTEQIIELLDVKFPFILDEYNYKLRLVK